MKPQNKDKTLLIVTTTSALLLSHFLRNSTDVYVLAVISILIIWGYFSELKNHATTQVPKFHLLFLMTILYGLTGVLHPVDSYLLLIEWQQFALVLILFSTIYRGLNQVSVERAFILVIAWLIIISGLANYQFFTGYDFSIYSHFGRTNRGKGFFDSWNILAGYIDLFIFLILALFITQKNKSNRWIIFSIIGIGVIFSGLLSTYSRAGWLAFIFGLILFSYLAPKRVLRENRGLIIATSLFLALLTIIYLNLPNAGGDLADRFRSIPLDPEELPQNLSGRPAIWEATLRMFQDAPLFGQGMGYFHYLTLKYYDPTATTAFFVTRAHSDYLQLLMELGIFGFLILLAFWIMFFRFLFTLYKTAKQKYDAQTQMKIAAGIAGIAAVFFHTSVDFDFYIPATVLAIAFLTVYLIRQFDHKDLPQLGPVKKYTVGLELAIVGIILILSISRSATQFEFEKGKAELNKSEIESAIYHFKLAHVLTPNYIPALQMLGLSQAAWGDVTQDAESLNEAESNLEKAVSLNKYNGVSYRMLMDFYKLHLSLYPDSVLSQKVDLYYSQLFEHIPNSGSTRREAAKDMQILGVSEKGISVLEEFLVIHPEDDRTRAFLIEYLTNLKTDSVEIARNISILEKSKNPIGQFNVGVYFQNMGEPDSALHYYQAALQNLKSESLEAINLAAKIVNRVNWLRQTNQGDSIKNAIYKNYGNKADFYAAFGKELISQNMDSLGMVMIQRGLNIDPENPRLIELSLDQTEKKD